MDALFVFCRAGFEEECAHELREHAKRLGIADRPARVADLAVRWLAGGWCRRFIFNRKLPIKRRYETAGCLLARIRKQLDSSGVACRVAAKQLCHDRADITVFVERRGRAVAQSAARRKRSKPASRSRRRSSGSSRPA